MGANGEPRRVGEPAPRAQGDRQPGDQEASLHRIVAHRKRREERGGEKEQEGDAIGPSKDAEPEQDARDQPRPRTIAVLSDQEAHAGQRIEREEEYVGGGGRRVDEKRLRRRQRQQGAPGRRATGKPTEEGECPGHGGEAAHPSNDQARTHPIPDQREDARQNDRVEGRVKPHFERLTGSQERRLIDEPAQVVRLGTEVQIRAREGKVAAAGSCQSQEGAENDAFALRGAVFASAPRHGVWIDSRESHFGSVRGSLRKSAKSRKLHRLHFPRRGCYPRIRAPRPFDSARFAVARSHRRDGLCRRRERFR